jgi:hypothetical protein
MNPIARASLLGTLLLGILAAASAQSQSTHSSKTMHAPGAHFQESLGEVVFSPGGTLFVAYRVPGKNKISSTLRVMTVDAVKEKQTAVIDYPVPPARLPRVPTHFMLSKDGSALAYAELHTPQVLLTIDASTLRLMSSAERNLFEFRDFAPHIKAFDKGSLILTAETVRTRRPYMVTHVRDVALAPDNLQQVIFETSVPPEESESEVQRWMNLSHEELTMVMPVGDGALGLTNLMKEGWVRRFDQDGKTVAFIHNRECGFSRASITTDHRFAVAVCEKIVSKPYHVEEILARKAIVFDANTLEVIGSFPISQMVLKEHGEEEDIWTATPVPAIWHGENKLIIAVPEGSNTIKLHSLSLQ